MHRLCGRIAIAVGTAALLYFFPLFRVVPLDRSDPQVSNLQAAAFDATTFVNKFWSQQLVPVARDAVAANELMAEISRDSVAAREAYGRRLGLSDTYFYCLSGTGRVVSVEKNAIGLAIDEEATQAQVLLETGIVFGNAVRDGSGLLDVNEFQNSQQFNAISTELNRRIENEVLPKLREAATVGAIIRFAGCAQVTDEETDLHPLRVVPFIGEAL